MTARPPKSPHMTREEVAETLAAIARDPARRADLAPRLAWRPAWAIRSRKGALRDFLSLFRRQ